MDYWRTYYAMKRRLGGEKLTVRDKLLMHRMGICPGCNAHQKIIGKRRGEILFNHYVGRQRSYAMYWRSHMDEYKETIANI